MRAVLLNTQTPYATIDALKPTTSMSSPLRCHPPSDTVARKAPTPREELCSSLSFLLASQQLQSLAYLGVAGLQSYWYHGPAFFVVRTS